MVFSISYVSQLQKLQNPWRYYESLRQKEVIPICGENQLPDIICAQELCPFVFLQQKLEVAAYSLL